jgi:hypothetical protein
MPPPRDPDDEDAEEDEDEDDADEPPVVREPDEDLSGPPLRRMIRKPNPSQGALSRSRLTCVAGEKS